MKNNKGITLIALVVTIIVLLILAGVSIAMLSGQNGILNRASQATWQSKLGDAESTVALSVSNFLTDYYAVKYTNADSEYTGDYKITGEKDTESTVLIKALNKAQKELGSSFAIYQTAAVEATEGTQAKNATICIEYLTNGKVYNVVGTINGSNVTWGKMELVSGQSTLHDPIAPEIPAASKAS